jgi:hypothetical protein
MRLLREWMHQPFQPVSRGAMIAWLVFYALMMFHIATDTDGFPVTHNANLIVHEAGHFLFGWFGQTIGILGGTLAEVLVPLLLAAYFLRQGHTVAVAFCVFWAFHTSSGIASYMADARTVALPLVGSGDHDWEMLFTQWGVLHRDAKIAGTVRFIGWLGMLATVAWFVWMSLRSQREPR